MNNLNPYVDQDLPRPLTNEETKYYVELHRDGNRNARNKLIEHNLLLTLHIARKFNSTGIDLDDLISIGKIGLIKAVDSFDPNKNVKLGTYAAICIKNEILMFLRKYKKFESIASLDGELFVNRDGDKFCMLDYLKSPNDVVQEYIDIEAQKEVENALKILDYIEREVIASLCGFYGIILTQDETAQKLKISQPHVSRVFKRAKLKIKLFLQSRGYFLDLDTEQMNAGSIDNSQNVKIII